jgi:hypothetical protein
MLVSNMVLTCYKLANQQIYTVSRGAAVPLRMYELYPQIYDEVRATMNNPDVKI